MLILASVSTLKDLAEMMSFTKNAQYRVGLTVRISHVLRVYHVHFPVGSINMAVYILWPGS